MRIPRRILFQRLIGKAIKTRNENDQTSGMNHPLLDNDLCPPNSPEQAGLRMTRRARQGLSNWISSDRVCGVTNNPGEKS